jgi:hypothetical protein
MRLMLSFFLFFFGTEGPSPSTERPCGPVSIYIYIYIYLLFYLYIYLFILFAIPNSFKLKNILLHFIFLVTIYKSIGSK